MDQSIYFQGFLITTALLAIEHAALYTVLKPRSTAGDIWRELARLILGTLAFLAGCAWIAWQSGYAIALLSPIAASMAGVVIAAAYAGRWAVARIKDAAYRRGRIHGLADKADIQAEERDGGR
jgi:hypothetical protein